MKTAVRSVVLVAIGSLALLGQAQAILWVSTTGSDATGDGSAGNPFATIQNAVHQAYSLSDYTINVMPGTYAGFWNETASGGKATQFITVRSYDPSSSQAGYNWKNTVINAAGPNGGPFVTTRTYVTGAHGEFYAHAFALEGFTVQGPGSGTGVSNGSVQGADWSNATVRNCVITGFGAGLYSDRRGLVVENSVVHGNVDGIYLTDAPEYADRKILRNVTVTNNSGRGIYTRRTGFYAYNSILYGNGTYDVADYKDKFSGGSTTITIHYSDLGATYSATYDGVPAMLYDLQNNLSVAPGFVGGPGADAYQLSAGSPVINQGLNAYVPAASGVPAQSWDLWGDARINPTVDMGADEYVAAPVPEPATLGLLVLGAVVLAARRKA